MIDGLTVRERQFLSAVGGGQSAAAFAHEQGFSQDWAKWMSRKIRSKLGVETIQEAIRLSDDGVSRADFDALKKLLEGTNEAVAALAAAAPHEREDAKKEVVTREMDEREMAKRLGITVDDLTKIRDENDFKKFKGMQERLDAERAAEAAADEEETDDEDEEKSGGIIRDGLGGIRNLAR